MTMKTMTKKLNKTVKLNINVRVTILSNIYEVETVVLEI